MRNQPEELKLPQRKCMANLNQDARNGEEVYRFLSIKNERINYYGSK